MGSEPYTVRELQTIFEEFKCKLDAIHEQVKFTNGRVSRLENWRWFITGGLAILSMLVIPLLVAVIT